MKLNTKGRYAVMAMADIARRGKGQSIQECKTIPMAQIAERQHISLPYLEQLFSKLRRAGLVESTRGPGGGYVLARPADEIYIGEIMLAVGEPVKMTRCDKNESGDGCIGGEDCITHTLWTALNDHIHLFLKSVSLQDVIDKRVGPFGPLASQLASSDIRQQNAKIAAEGQ